jgi:hypothetical protein
MHPNSTPTTLLQPFYRHLTRPQRQNFLALVVAVQCARTLVLRQLALFLCLGISSASCYRHLQRVLAWEQEQTWKPLSQFWVRTVLRCFAPGRGRVPLLIDWTMHRDRCRSLWVMLPVGGRAVPLAFWLAANELGGPGSQRAFEDQALTELAAWLPPGRPVVLIGDRGFRGVDRIRFLRQLGWGFLLRVTGDTQAALPTGKKGRGRPRWAALRTQAPAVGGRWQHAHVRFGKTRPERVHLVAIRQPLLTPKRVLTPKGKKTDQLATETTWFLVTDLPLTLDAVQVYAWRMQIEQTFRDYKALFGMEQERTQQPTQRLVALLWALMVGMALDVQSPVLPQGTGDEPALAAAGAHPQVPPWPRWEPAPPVASSPERPQYPSESRTRAGLHQFVVQLFLGQLPFQAELQALYAKSQRLRDRPQVRDRRREQPALRHRITRNPSKIPA